MDGVLAISQRMAQIEATLGFRYADEIVHRNDLVLLDEPGYKDPEA